MTNTPTREVSKAAFDFSVGQRVAYVPTHLQGEERDFTHKDIEVGFVSSIREDVTDFIWVRFKGPNGERCSIKDVYAY